mgnify:CR=1 FL=1
MITAIRFPLSQGRHGSAWGRIGSWFGIEQWKITPDIIATAKGISGGYTPLAAVILRMKSLHLGEPGEFPFVEPPPGRAIADGYQLLAELNAVDDDNELTPIGRELAKLPVDPRVGRRERSLEQFLGPPGRGGGTGGVVGRRQDNVGFRRHRGAGAHRQPGTG